MKSNSDQKQTEKPFRCLMTSLVETEPAKLLANHKLGLFPVATCYKLVTGPYAHSTFKLVAKKWVLYWITATTKLGVLLL